MASVRERTWITANGETKLAWQADYLDQHKVCRTKTFATRKAAQIWLVAALGEIAAGRHTPERQSKTLYEAAQLWLERCRAEGLEPATLRGYATIVERHIGPTLGAAKLAQLTTPMLETWRDRLLTTPDGTDGKPRSRSRARQVLTALKMILKHAQKRGLVAQNVALSVQIESKGREQKKLVIGQNVPGRDDIQKLLAACPPGRRRALLITAVFTGMRSSELRGLRWDAVDFAKKTITVCQRADECGIIGNPKSRAGQREIPMSKTVCNTLREWKLACPKGELGLVFPNTRGRIEMLSGIRERFWCRLQAECGLVDEAGRPRFSFHKLRHFAASHWIALGFSPKRLQEMLGHSSITMTFDRYGHWFPSLEDDFAKLDQGEIGLVG